MNNFFITIQQILEFKRYKIYVNILLLCLLFIFALFWSSGVYYNFY